VIRTVRRLVLAGLAVAVAVVGYGAFRIWDQGRIDQRRPADALVVLGAAQYDGRPSPVFAARLDHAVAEFLTGDYRYLVVTGGKAEGDRTTEAAVARAYAIARGVPGDRILVEDQGRTTLGSLGSVARILGDHQITDAVFVSDPTHMLRVLRIAGDLGLQAWGSPTSTSPVDSDPSRLVAAYAHELGALALYLTVGGESVESR
jgi:uncharacterized SAM-binding protein YcdF (DUF218 family)